MTAPFEGQVAVVSGASSGIGRATAVAFARRGATVVVVARSADSLNETVSLIQAEGGTASAVTADVTSSQDVANVVREAVARYGRLDIAFNNVGILRPEPIIDMDEDTWELTLRTNLTSVWLGIKHQIAYMREHGGGSIINTSSIPTSMLPGHGAYGAAKAGVSALTRAAAREHVADGIRVNAVCPGPVDTAMSRQPGESDADRNTRIASVHPMGRVASTDEIAAAVLWLASPHASYVTGHELVVDGGATA